jgi:pantoate--beta-alanine ligase
MGALHEGHLSLVRRCVSENDVCVTSIFVNPAQFNDKEDLAAYPRTPKEDYALLESSGCHYVFAPSEAEMYPTPDLRTFDFGTLASVMEGKYRPGHFNGVAQVVSKLFDAVQPGKAYFGEKDFQQVAVIKAMTAQLKLPVQIVPCPIVREADGLAMSSRNARLTPEQRKVAPIIARTLQESLLFAAANPVWTVSAYVVAALKQEPLLDVEYFDIVNGHTLMPIRKWEEAPYAVGCIAVHCGETRLIDNITYQKAR